MFVPDNHDYILASEWYKTNPPSEVTQKTGSDNKEQQKRNKIDTFIKNNKLVSLFSDHRKMQSTSSADLHLDKYDAFWNKTKAAKDRDIMDSGVSGISHVSEEDSRGRNIHSQFLNANLYEGIKDEDIKNRMTVGKVAGWARDGIGDGDSPTITAAQKSNAMKIMSEHNNRNKLPTKAPTTTIRTTSASSYEDPDIISTDIGSSDNRTLGEIKDLLSRALSSDKVADKLDTIIGVLRDQLEVDEEMAKKITAAKSTTNNYSVTGGGQNPVVVNADTGEREDFAGKDLRNIHEIIAMGRKPSFNQ
jgi:hypothetical protein